MRSPPTTRPTRTRSRTSTSSRRKAEDADNPTYLKLVEIYQNTQDVLDGVLEASGGTAVLVKTPVDELVTSLTDVEDDIRAN